MKAWIPKSQEDHFCHGLLDKQLALNELRRSADPALIAKGRHNTPPSGTFAVSAYTGITRLTKDMDIFCKAGDAQRLLAYFQKKNYTIDIEDDRMVKIVMTLTAPGCPVAGEMPGWVENAVGSVEGVSGVEVAMTFDPPWTPDRMSEEAQVAIGWY